MTSESAPCGSNGKGEVNKTCRDAGSNRGPLALQSNALPTELSRLLLLMDQDFLEIFKAGRGGTCTYQCGRRLARTGVFYLIIQQK